MKHKAIRVDNLMYKGCEPHWKCTLCGDVVPFHCYTKEEFENLCCGCHRPNCKNCNNPTEKVVKTMPDKKLTDNEIIKALEICSGAENTCKNCYLSNYSMDYNACMAKLMTDVKDLINRLQAENENLKVELQSMRDAANSLKIHYEKAQTEIERLEKESNDKERAYTDEYCLRKEWQRRCRELLEEKQNAKSEAIKEFAKRLKNEIISDTTYGCDINQHTGYYDYQIKIGDIPEYIDNLLKEMVGENNDS